MKISEEVSMVVEEALATGTKDGFSVEENLVNFFEHLGLEEGVDYCIDEGEVFIPDDVELDEDYKLEESKNFKKWSGVNFKPSGDMVSVEVEHPEIKPLTIPNAVYQFLEKYHSKMHGA